ncbi:MAG: hypothetical protein AB8G23_22910 [Myxococcota bacterium]
MLNSGAGKDFRVGTGVEDRARSSKGEPRVLIVDPVIGSRLFLADCVSQSGFSALTAANSADALIALGREDIALVLVDEEIGGEGAIQFLVDLRERFPSTARALIAEGKTLAVLGNAVEQAELSFLLAKPLDQGALGAALLRLVRGDRAFKDWDRVGMARNGLSQRRILKSAGAERIVSGLGENHRHEVILRGLLAGLNSVESEAQLFDLIDHELTEAFQIHRWLRMDHSSRDIIRVETGQLAQPSRGQAEASPSEEALLAEAERYAGIRKLNPPSAGRPGGKRAGTCLGFVMGEAAGPRLTCLVYCDASTGDALLEMFRDLRHGLNLTIRRIGDAARRSDAARELANLVSEELKTPVGALTHAIHRMRGEAARAGVPTEWVERVLSESQRVVRAVDQLEGEVFAERPVAPLP